MALWYPLANATNTLAGAFGSLNAAVSGNVLINADWFWTFIAIAIFLVIELVFVRNGSDFIQSTTVSSLAMLVLSTILFTIGIIFIIVPLSFFLLFIVMMALGIANKPDY